MSFLKNPDFKDLLDALERAEVRYLIVGGHAVGFHTRPRATKDLDLWIGEEHENRLRMVEALRVFNAPEAICKHLEDSAPDDIVWFGRAPHRIDILQHLPGVDFAKAIRRAVHARVAGIRVSIMSVEDLIANKKAVARDQDLLDVKALERTLTRKE